MQIPVVCVCVHVVDMSDSWLVLLQQNTEQGVGPACKPYPSMSKFSICPPNLVGNSDASNLVISLMPLLPANNLHVDEATSR